jgi:hypothetical protein
LAGVADDGDAGAAVLGVVFSSPGDSEDEDDGDMVSRGSPG